MGSCISCLNLKVSSGNESMDDSIYKGRASSKRSYSSRQTNSSGLGSACSTTSSASTNRSRSIWSRSGPTKSSTVLNNSITTTTATATTSGSNQTESMQVARPICDDFAEQPIELEHSHGYYTCSSSISTPSNSRLLRTMDMGASGSESSTASNESFSPPSSLTDGNLEWEMYMMRHAECIMPKTSSPKCQRRSANDATIQMPGPSKSYHIWRNYLQTTPAHMLHNVTNIPEAIAGHFCPSDFPAFSDLEEMESAAKRYKVDVTVPDMNGTLIGQTQTTDL